VLLTSKPPVVQRGAIDYQKSDTKPAALMNKRLPRAEYRDQNTEILSLEIDGH
jgi:hypothetical protein